MYVTVTDANTVAIVNTYLDLIEEEVVHPAIQGPMGISVTSNGAYVFVSNQNSQGMYAALHTMIGEPAPGTLVVIETATATVVKAIELPSKPGLMGSRVVIPTFR